MSEFNFGSLATTQATSNTQQRLKPWGIYPVKFSGARKETIQGKKDPSKTYEILKVRFDGEDGFYEESIFYPKPEDTERPKYKNSEGHEYEGASNFERTMTFIAQVSEVLNPEGFKKLQAASSKFRSFDDVVTSFIKITDVVKGKETNLKLVGRIQNGNVIAALPKFVAINKNGEKFTSDNFLGEKLFFSAYEEAKKAEFANAKPTSMNQAAPSAAAAMAIDGVGASEEPVDFDALLA